MEYRSLQLADEIRADMDTVADAITELRKSTDAEREWLGLPKIIRASDVTETAVLLDQLAETPGDGVPERWLAAAAVADSQRTTAVAGTTHSTRKLARATHIRRRPTTRLPGMCQGPAVVGASC